MDVEELLDVVYGVPIVVLVVAVEEMLNVNGKTGLVAETKVDEVDPVDAVIDAFAEVGAIVAV